MWLKLLSVFGLGAIGLWEGVPAGFALRLHPATIGLAAGLGSTVATLAVLLLGDRLRARLLPPRAASDKVPRERLIDRVWRRYGVVGLGLLGPGLTGGPIGVALGLSLGVPARRLMLWMMCGIVLWTLGLTVAGIYSTAGILRLMGR